MEVRQLEKNVFNNNVKNNQAKDILAHQPAKGFPEAQERIGSKLE